MSSQWSTLSIWNRKIQITLVTVNKAIVFKSHATVNAWQVMRYSMIAQKVTDGCGLLKKTLVRFWSRMPYHLSFWRSCFLRGDSCVPGRHVGINRWISRKGMSILQWYFIEKFNWCGENASCCVPLGSWKLIRYGTNHGTVVRVSRTLASVC